MPIGQAERETKEVHNGNTRTKIGSLYDSKG